MKILKVERKYYNMLKALFRSTICSLLAIIVVATSLPLSVKAQDRNYPTNIQSSLSLNSDATESTLDAGVNYSDEKELYFSLQEKNGSEISTYKLALIVSKIKYNYNSSTKKFDFSINIDCPNILINKPKINLEVTIKRASYKDGIYSDVITKDFGHVGRTGHVWTYNYSDSVSGKSMSEPPTSYVKEALYTRPSNLNTKYKTWYDSVYNTNLNLTGYQVHHIRPLAYGGNNEMYNLIHLTEAWHSAVSGWFQGY